MAETRRPEGLKFPVNKAIRIRPAPIRNQFPPLASAVVNPESLKPDAFQKTLSVRPITTKASAKVNWAGATEKGLVSVTFSVIDFSASSPGQAGDLCTWVNY
jgi:hypothetical protein